MVAARVLMLSDYAGPDGGAASGGAGIAVLESYRALRQAGVDVRLITGFGRDHAGDPEDAIWNLAGQDLREGPPAAAWRTLFNPDAAATLRPIFAGEDPERTVIIVHQWTRYLTAAAIALLRRFPTMIYMHDYFWMCPNGAYFDFRRNIPCHRRPGRLACMAASCDRQGAAYKAVRLARHAALGIAASGTRRRRVHLHLSQAAQAVAAPFLPGAYNAVLHNPAIWRDDRDPTPTGRRLYDVGYFGRLEPQKGVAALASALAARGLRGLFVGEGSLAGLINATPGLTRLDWQPHHQVTALMRACRLVALPSLWPETWGLVVPEAMAAGVAVLVSTRAGSSELVERFGGGMVYDPADDGALDRALARLEQGVSVLPLGPSGQAGLRYLLSPQRHAEHLIEIAADAWGIDIAPTAAIGEPALAL